MICKIMIKNSIKKYKKLQQGDLKLLIKSNNIIQTLLAI